MTEETNIESKATGNKIGTLVFKGISFLIHPLLMPTFALLIIFASGSYHSYLNTDVKKLIFSVYFIATVLLPLSVFPFLYYQKVIKSWTMADHRERVLPILIVSAFQFFAWYMINKYPIPPLYKSFVFYSALGSLITAIASTKINLSLHMLAIGGLIGFTLSLAFAKMLDLHFILMITILAAGFLAMARLGLQRNSATSIYGSFAFGFILMYVPMFYF